MLGVVCAMPLTLVSALRVASATSGIILLHRHRKHRSDIYLDLLSLEENCRVSRSCLTSPCCSTGGVVSLWVGIAFDGIRPRCGGIPPCPRLCGILLRGGGILLRPYLFMPGVVSLRNPTSLRRYLLKIARSPFTLLGVFTNTQREREKERGTE